MQLANVKRLFENRFKNIHFLFQSNNFYKNIDFLMGRLFLSCLISKGGKNVAPKRALTQPSPRLPNDQSDSFGLSTAKSKMAVSPWREGRIFITRCDGLSCFQGQ